MLNFPIEFMVALLYGSVLIMIIGSGARLFAGDRFFRLRWGVFSLKNGGLPVSSLVNGKMVLKHVPCDGKVELWSS